MVDGNKFSPNQLKQLKDAFDNSMSDKFGLGAERVKMLGGFLDMFDEGSKIYESKINSIRNTGKLLDSIIGDEGQEGLVGRLAGISEGSFRFFGRIKEGAEATDELTQNLRSFVMASKDQQAELSQQAALFKALGVQVSDFTSVIDSARLAFQMSSADAANLSRQIAEVGNATGVGMGKAMANFKSAQQSMAYDSGKLMQTFRSLQLTSAQTGIGFDKLASSFGDTMDTFEGSANKAGSLNAILGKSVFNSIEFLGQSEAERIETIVKGIKENVDMQALGKNKFQLKAISKGLGLSPEETRRLLTGQMSVDEALAQKTEGDPRAKATKKMAELLSQEVNPSLDDFGNLLKTMRTAQGQGIIDLNDILRRQAKDLTGFDSPTEIFETVQSSLRELGRRGATDDLKKRAGEIKTIFSTYTDEVKAAGDADDPAAALAAASKTMLTNISNKLKEIKAAVPLTPDTAQNPASKARQAAQMNIAQVNIGTNKMITDALAPLADVFGRVGKRLESGGDVDLFGGTRKIILQIGNQAYDAMLKLGKVDSKP